MIKHDRDDIHTENDELLPGGAFYVLRLFIGPWRASQRGADPMCAVMDPLADAQSIQRPDNRKVNASCVGCLLYTSPSPRDGLLSRMPSSA